MNDQGKLLQANHVECIVGCKRKRKMRSSKGLTIKERREMAITMERAKQLGGPLGKKIGAREREKHGILSSTQVTVPTPKRNYAEGACQGGTRRQDNGRGGEGT